MPLARYPDGGLSHVHGFSELSGTGLLVRGKSFLLDKKKVETEPALLDLACVDMFYSTEPIKHAAVCRDAVKQAIAETSAGELCFVAHLMMGNCLGGNASLNCTSVFRTTSRKSGPSAQCAAHELLRQYKEGDDVFRNSRLKLIPRILSGNLLVRKVVGDRPVMLGKAVQLTHYVGTSYIETDVDVNSSRVASYICRVALLQAQSNVLDIAFVLQANTAEELPERILGGVRLHKCKLDS